MTAPLNTKARIVNADGTNVGILRSGSPLLGNANPSLKIRIVQDLQGSQVPKSDEAILAIDDAWGIQFGASEQSLVKNPRPAAC